jgi:hypothetical protein
VNGSKIFEEKNKTIGEHKYNIEKLNSGIYFIRLKDGDEQINRKTVIIR